MTLTKLWLAIPALAAISIASVAGTAICQAAPGCQACEGCQAAAAACQPQFQIVERTVLVPTMVPEIRTVNVTQYRSEERQSKYTVYRPVPETKEVEYQFTVMVPETRTRTETCTVNKPVMETQTQQFTVLVPQTRTRVINCLVNKPVMETLTQQFTVLVPQTRSRTVNCIVNKPVYETQTQTFTVQVPYQETRQATRKVCRMVPVTVMKTVYEDQGHWEEVPVENCQPACGAGCAEQPAQPDDSNRWLASPSFRRLRQRLLLGGWL